MRVEQTFEGGRTPGGASRWSQGKEAEWVSVRPELVCEVAYDYLQGNRFRHASTFLRWRDDKKPEDCRFDQLKRLTRAALPHGVRMPTFPTPVSANHTLPSGADGDAVGQRLRASGWGTR